MKNGRCKFHGGMSTGAKTPEGLERMRLANTKHGRYSKQAMAEQRLYRLLLRESRQLLSAIAATATVCC